MGGVYRGAKEMLYAKTSTTVPSHSTNPQTIIVTLSPLVHERSSSRMMSDNNSDAGLAPPPPTLKHDCA